MSTLPTELIFRILSYSDPRDIVQWRTVSKMFSAVTYDVALWKALYRNASFPRPPGPFSTQPGPSLERTLLRAARLAESWTTRPTSALLSFNISVGEGHRPWPRPIAGRWLLVCEQDVRFVLRPLDPAKNKTPHVLWEQETQISGWDAESFVSPEGIYTVYVVLNLPDRSPCWKLLEFRFDYDTGEPLSSTTINPPHGVGDPLLKVKLYVANSRFLFIPAEEHQLVLDSQTHVFHTVRSLDEVPFPHQYLEWIIFSDASLIALCGNDDVTAIYVFVLTPDGTADETMPRTLHLTHRGIVDDHILDVKVMRPTIDLATGATKIRLLNYYKSRNQPRLKCVEMTLPKYSPGAVLPINIETNYISLPWEGVFEHYVNLNIDISDDGQIRGLCRAQRLMASGAESQCVIKFYVDTARDPWVITRNQIAPAEWKNEWEKCEWNNCDEGEMYRWGGADAESVRGEADIFQDIEFDGMRGQLCYAYRWSRRILVVDIE